LRGLARNDLFTVVAEHFMTDTGRYADIVLPATMAIEHRDLLIAYGHLYTDLERAGCSASRRVFARNGDVPEVGSSDGSRYTRCKTGTSRSPGMYFGQSNSKHLTELEGNEAAIRSRLGTIEECLMESKGD
jgi:hypothetical protein